MLQTEPQKKASCIPVRPLPVDAEVDMWLELLEKFPAPRVPWDRRGLLERLHCAPEVTFSSGPLDAIDNEVLQGRQLTGEPRVLELASAAGWSMVGKFCSSVLPPSLGEVGAEIERCIARVIRPTKGTLWWHPGDSLAPQFLPDAPRWSLPIHLANSPLSGLFQCENGQWLTLNLEPGCLELNQAPSPVPLLRSRWEGVFERALAEGFNGYNYFASGGGGGHLHFSFGREGLFPFLTNQRLLGRLLLVPQLLPGVVHVLSECTDRGADSSVRRIADLFFGEESTCLKDIGEAEILLKLLVSGQLKQWFNPEDGKPLLPNYFRDHDSAISLKKFPRSLEVRFFRAFNGLDDLAAAADLMVALLANLDRVSFEDASSHLAPLGMVSEQRLRSQFRCFLRDVGMRGAQREALWSFGGDLVTEEVAIEPGLDKALTISGRHAPLWEGHLPAYDLVVPTRQFQIKGDERGVLDLFYDVNLSGEIRHQQVDAKNGVFGFRLDGRPGLESRVFARFSARGRSAEEDRTLSWGSLALLPREDGLHRVGYRDGTTVPHNEASEVFGSTYCVLSQLDEPAAKRSAELLGPLFPSGAGRAGDFAVSLSVRLPFDHEGDVTVRMRGVELTGTCYMICGACWMAIPGPLAHDKQTVQLILGAFEERNPRLRLFSRPGGKLLWEGRPL